MRLGLRSLGINIAGTFARQVAALVVGIGLSAILGRLLGKEGVGLYAATLLVANVLYTATNLGIPAANGYYLARGVVSPRRALRVNLLWWIALSSVVGASAWWALGRYGANWFNQIPVEFLRLGALAFPAIMLHTFVNSLFQGLQDFKRFNIIVLLVPVMMLICVTGMMAWKGATPYHAALGFVVAHVIIAPIAYAIFQSRLPAEHHPGKLDDVFVRKSAGYGGVAHIATNLAFWNYRLDQYLVNYFVGPAGWGIYYIGVSIAEKVWMVSHSVSTVMFPRLSSLAEDESARLALTQLVTRFLFALTVVVGAVLFLLAPTFVTIVYGSDFAVSGQVLRWLVPGIVFGAVARAVSTDLAARGRVDINLYVAVFVLAINVCANLYLIPRHGVVGAAMGTSLAYTANMLIRMTIYGRIAKTSPLKLVAFSPGDLRWAREQLALLRAEAKG